MNLEKSVILRRARSNLFRYSKLATKFCNWGAPATKCQTCRT